MDISKWGRKAFKEASERLLDVADRVDERGGELRDQLKERLVNSRRLAALKDSLKKRTPSDLAHEPTSTQEPPQTAASKSRAPDVFSYGDERKVAQVFGARSCPWSGRSMRLFESAGIAAVYLDLDLEGSGSIREELRAQTGQQTIPYIYLRGQFVGGFNALDEIYRLGRLPYYILSATERLAHPDHGTIEVAQRSSNIDAFERPPE